MLRLEDITKVYEAGTGDVKALDGVSVSFRQNEFVSILGPSGSGKTTLLNIIGGLDKYTSGDLLICGRSTKDFKDRDWDLYRNQRIGFIFQSYNLIPHQTVLQNVELALTISGVKGPIRRQRAIEALEKVGLKDQILKRPNQLSGGQCQRVAIARALVNDPEILLADEPTGALDTHTSVQIMNLIKEIAKERLVIMVTHNPDIAKAYSTRIIRLIDGTIVEDTNEYSPLEEKKEVEGLPEEERNKTSKAKMSWATATRLSFRNLLSKAKRTALVAIAGSIGIIGISSVLAVSNGVTSYIESMQDDMLSGNPVTISETTIDFGSLMETFTGMTAVDYIQSVEGKVTADSMIEYLVKRSDSLTDLTKSNEITDTLISYLEAMPKEYLASISFDNGLNLNNNIYTKTTVDSSGFGEKTVSLSALKETFKGLLGETSFADYLSLIDMVGDPLEQMPGDAEYILSQYDVLAGKVAEEADEVMLVVDSHSSVTDIMLAELGYYTQQEFENVCFRATEDENYDEAIFKNMFDYSEILQKTFFYYPNDDVFVENADSATKNSVPFNYKPYADTLGEGYRLNVVGILQPKADISYGCLKRGFYYTPGLAVKALADNIASKIVENLNETGKTAFTSMKMGALSIGLPYTVEYWHDGQWKQKDTFCGDSSLISSVMGGGVYSLSLRELGGKATPEKISLYPVDFALKDGVTSYLDEWNSDNVISIGGVDVAPEDRAELTYNDNLGLVIGLVNVLIDSISIALIVFTGLSLVVSCVMIAVITYISVVERVKEIGVIRSLGGRKKDVSHLFNAETLIIGFLSGTIGVAFTYLLCLLLNAIIVPLGAPAIGNFKPTSALIMVALSIILNVLSGLFPSRKAAKQDPVQALRTE